jgi:hypothetical protein
MFAVEIGGVLVIQPVLSRVLEDGRTFNRSRLVVLTSCEYAGLKRTSSRLKGIVSEDQAPS